MFYTYLDLIPSMPTNVVDTRRGTIWAQRLMRGFGWASLAMGLALLAPARAARLFGLGTRPRLMCAIAARDLVIGLGLLRHHQSAQWLRVQALADLVDAAIVGAGLMTGAVARRRGMAWLVVALGSGWASFVAARRLDVADGQDAVTPVAPRSGP